MTKPTFFYNLIQEQKIFIPLIQRDYAQGRRTDTIKDIRAKFLNSLYEACHQTSISSKTTPLVLDFIYGVSENDSFLPFDGQQRLTTLFLLHYYAALKENKLNETVQNILLKFSYEIRESTTVFMEYLIKDYEDIKKSWAIIEAEQKINPDEEKKKDEGALSQAIKQQAWYVAQWQFEATISGMLTMLDAIADKFNDINNLWEVLTKKNAIGFLYTPLKNLSLSADEIYVKMNARGKQLTEFENFKALFIDYIKEKLGEEQANSIARKLDTKWTNFFWKSRPTGNKTDPAQACDAAFVRFLRFMAYIFQTFHPLNTEEKNNEIKKKNIYQNDIFEMLRLGLENTNIINTINVKNLVLGKESKNFDVLFLLLNKLAEKGSQKIQNIFDSVFYHNRTDKINKPSPEKVALYTFDQNIFTRIVWENKESSYQEDIILFAFFLNILRDDFNEINLREDMRILRNLLENTRVLGSNISRLLQETAELCLSAKPLNELYDVQNISTGFDTYQMREEISKLEFKKIHESDKQAIDAINCLENHVFCQGNLGGFTMIGDNEDDKNIIFDKDILLAGKKLFESFSGQEPTDLTPLQRALLTKDDYSYSVNYYVTLGHSQNKTTEYPWKNIFSRTVDNKITNCRRALQSLCDDIIKDQPNDIFNFLDELIVNWLEDCEKKSQFNWHYYLIKYIFFKQETKHGLFLNYTKERKFESITLFLKRRSGPYWSGFLRQLADKFGITEKEQKNYILQGLGLKLQDGLYLHIHEQGWQLSYKEDWINLKDNGHDIDQDFLKKIRAIDKNYTIDDDGCIKVPGKNYDNNDKCREYDTENRIEFIYDFVKAGLDKQKSS